MRTQLSRALIALSCLTAVACGGTVASSSTTPVQDDAQQYTASSYFQIGGDVSNFGQTSLVSGFLPDPFTVDVVSGSTAEDEVTVDGLGLVSSGGGVCTGFATREPDYILHFESGEQALRFFVTAAEDTTLIINDGAGNWWCSDDDGGNLNPMIDIPNAPSGQYDIWVGSYQQDANIQGVLSVTELLDTVHP